MKVEAYIIAWNEIETIHLTINHYQSFCDSIIIYDNYSTDGTFEACVKLGCEVKRFGKPGVLDDSQYLKVKNHCWKDSNADWVIVVDADEIIYHPDIKEVLKNELNEGSTLFRTIGWNVFSEHMPAYNWLEILTGINDQNYAKRCVFSPKIKEIDYVYGCHVARPQGDIQPTRERLVLLHYRNVGGVDRLINRHKIYRKRLSEKNKRFGLGVHYTYTDEQRRKDFKEKLEKSTNLDLCNINRMVQPVP